MKPDEKRFMWFLCSGVAALFLFAITLTMTGVLGYVLDPDTNGSCTTQAELDQEC
jgi:hypothetical protein